MTKPTKWHVRPVKTQISPSIRPVRSESSLSAWIKLGSIIATHWAHSEDSDQTGRGCPGWSESSLGSQPFCWFCHEAAHIRTYRLGKQCRPTSECSFRICTVCRSVCFFWTHKCTEKSHCSKFRIITTLFGCPNFSEFHHTVYVKTARTPLCRVKLGFAGVYIIS